MNTWNECRAFQSRSPARCLRRKETYILASLPVAPLVHEPLEFLAILGVTEIFHVVREFALGGGEPFALFFEPREFGGAPLVESAISGRARGKALPIACRKAPAAGAPVCLVAPFFSPEKGCRQGTRISFAKISSRGRRGRLAKTR